MTEDYRLDQSEGKRYSLDPGDSAFGPISSSYSPKSYGFRSSQQFSNGMCRQSSSGPNSFAESNRTGGAFWEERSGSAAAADSRKREGFSLISW